VGTMARQKDDLMRSPFPGITVLSGPGISTRSAEWIGSCFLICPDIEHFTISRQIGVTLDFVSSLRKLSLREQYSAAGT